MMSGGNQKAVPLARFSVDAEAPYFVNFVPPFVCFVVAKPKTQTTKKPEKKGAKHTNEEARDQ